MMATLRRHVGLLLYWVQKSGSFFVGDDIAEADIKAGYDKGVLSLFIPKQGTNVKQKKYIAIE